MDSAVKAATQVIGSCGNFCDQCINTGCPSISVHIDIPKPDVITPETSSTRKTETPCRFCGNEQDSCNICGLDEEKPDISSLEVISISPTENLEEQTSTDPVATPQSPIEVSSEVTSNSYQCSECEKKFVTKSRLKKHIMTHSPSKPHHCRHCKWLVKN